MDKTKPKLRLSLFLAAIVSLASAASVAQAQSNYPNRVIKIVVAVPAGGAADTLARIVADKLTAKWGKPVIVENHPGGTGNVAAEAVWRAQPDGYTLLLTPPPPLAINQSLYAKLPFVPDKFKPVTVIAAVPNVLLVHHDFPASNLRELIALAKANPNKFSYASTGPGSTSHLSAELVKSVAGINILHVPYKSPSEAILDVLSRRVDMTFANLLDALPHINDGALRVLGVGSSARSFALPDVPTLSETLPGVVSDTWYAIVAPPETPADIVARLSSAIAEAIVLPAVAQRLRDLHASPIGDTPADAAAFLKEETERWHNVIVSAGIKLD